MKDAAMTTIACGGKSQLQQKTRASMALQAQEARIAGSLEELGNRLSQTRRARNITQSDMALQAGIGLSTVVALEAGKPGVGMGYFLQILDALGLLDQVDQLLAPKLDDVMLQHAVSTLPKRAGKKRGKSK